MRITRYDKQLNKYTTEKTYTDIELIRILGEAEDRIDKINERTETLIDSMMNLLEITKGEKEDLMNKIRKEDDNR